jgi:hypothetical protein
MTRLRLAPVLALAVVSFAASAAAAPVFIQGADSTTITSVLPPRGQGANCCGTCAGNDACPDCACWAVSMGMLLSYWDDTSYGGEGPWERMLPGGDAVDTEAFRATTQTLFDLFGGGSCEGSGTGLFFWFFCAEDRGLLETYNSSLGYSFQFFDHDWLDWNEDVVVELNTWKPVYYGYYPEGGGSHVVLLVGYDEVDRTMWLYNTWDYAAHVKGFDEAWNHCAITTVPGGSDCTTGPCCSPLGAYRSHTYTCGIDAEREVGCPWGLACGQDLGVRTRDRLCTGAGTECNGELGPWKEWAVLADCGDTESCDAAGERCAAGGACGCDCAAGAAARRVVARNPAATIAVRMTAGAYRGCRLLSLCACRRLAHRPTSGQNPLMPDDKTKMVGKPARTRPANFFRAIVLGAATAAAPMAACDSAVDYGAPGPDDSATVDSTEDASTTEDTTAEDATGDEASGEEGTVDYGVPDAADADADPDATVDYGVPDGADADASPDSIVDYGVPDAIPPYGVPDGSSETGMDYGAPLYGVPADAGKK